MTRAVSMSKTGAVYDGQQRDRLREGRVRRRSQKLSSAAASVKGFTHRACSSLTKGEVVMAWFAMAHRAEERVGGGAGSPLVR